MIKSFYDLRVYQEGYTLAVMMHKITHTFPKSERYGLIDQLKRAAISIPANIAEGYGTTTGEFKRYLRISLGSCNEVRVYIDMAKDLGYLTEIHYKELSDRYESLSKQIYQLLNKWK